MIYNIFYKVLLYLIGAFVFSTMIFGVIFCIDYVFNKNYDLKVMYFFCVIATLLSLFYITVGNYLLLKAQKAFNQEDYETAFSIIKKLAKHGVSAAQYQLSIYYKNGFGTPKDEEQFLYWLEKAANNNLFEAQILYAAVYMENKHNMESLEVARYYLNLAVKKTQHPRHQEALEQLANLEKILVCS